MKNTFSYFFLSLLFSLFQVPTYTVLSQNSMDCYVKEAIEVFKTPR